MKSKVNKEFVRKPAEFFKNSSLNFLEGERNFVSANGSVRNDEQLKNDIAQEVKHKVVEELKNEVKDVKNEVEIKNKVDVKNDKGINEISTKKEVQMKKNEKDEKFFKNSCNTFLDNERYESKVDEKRQNSSTIEKSQERYVFSAGSLKRYVTTCYFQPKQIPVSYSETMILNIGSSKKRFFESIYYKNTIVPHKWSESMHTMVNKKPETTFQVSEVTIPVVKPDFHYISLEPQQEMAQKIQKYEVPQEMAV